MAKKQDNELERRLRDSGVRKKVARAVTESAGRGDHRDEPMLARTIENLRTAAAEIEDRARAPQRSEAAKKAARTRKRKAAERSAAARKAAKSRSKAT
jgi:hypothetical protein